MVQAPRGIRNNNPGNIRHGQDWQGMAPEQTDRDFVQFITPEMGIRALAKVLATYESRGLRTVRTIISRWAPPEENDTESYIAAVSKEVGVNPDTPLESALHLPRLMQAIIRHENGQQPYTDDQIAKGIALA